MYDSIFSVLIPGPTTTSKSACLTLGKKAYSISWPKACLIHNRASEDVLISKKTISPFVVFAARSI